MTPAETAEATPPVVALTTSYTALPENWGSGAILGSAQISIRVLNLVWYGTAARASAGAAPVRLLGRSPHTLLVDAIAGSCDIRAGGRRMRAGSGTVAVIRSGESVDSRHTDEAGGRMAFRYLEIGAYVWDGLDVFRLLEPPEQLSGDDAAFVAAAMDRLVDAEGEPFPLVRTARRAEVGHSVVSFLCARSSLQPWADEAMGAIGRVAPLLRRINDSLADDYDIPRLARLAGMSRSSLHRHFALALGTSPLAYIRQRRLDAAAAELLGTGDTLDVIAGRARFASGSHLIRAFKERFGVTPGEYRRQRERKASP